MNTPGPYPILSTIDDPSVIRKLSDEQLQQLSDELRAYLIETVAKSGGHFGAGLGCVELTVALHAVFDTPNDHLVWDVGHQAYPHKILTGRRDLIGSIKKKDGLSPFPKRSESPYDAFGVGHSSTSISAATGMALADLYKGKDSRSIAVIGDGAMTAGMAFEALNHAGEVDPNIIVVLNENRMSISANVGALSSFLSRLVAGNHYTHLREKSKQLMTRDSQVWRFMSRWEEHVKGMFVPSTLFEELGFNYFGPVDGHDLPYLLKSMHTLKSMDGPQLLHVITQKGKGYAPAENDPVRYHAVSPFNPAEGMLKPVESKSSSKSYTEVFSQWLLDMAEKDERLVAITPAMKEGSGLVDFAGQFPDRYHDVGIAEQHSVTLAAGMACEGLKPVVAIYSSFLQRAYDQLIHDVALQKLPVLFAIDRAGLVGPDGPTHAGSFDLAFLRLVPNMVIMAPATESECREMLYTGFQHNGPVAVRYPRGKASGKAVSGEMNSIPLGKGEIIRKGQDIALLCFGTLLDTCLAAGDTLNASVVNMRFVKPLDIDLVLEMASTHKLLVTVEENSIAGGAGSAVNEALMASNQSAEILNLGIPDRFIEHGSREQCLEDCGLDYDGILSAINQRIQPTGQDKPGWLSQLS